MSKTAEKPQEQEDETLNEELENQENQNLNPDDDSDSDNEELEIVLEGEGSQPKEKTPKNKSIRNRINKLNGKLDQEKQEHSKTATELAAERERARILELELQQHRSKPQEIAMPNPADFDGGVEDPDFISKKAEYDQHIIDKAVDKRFSEKANSSNQQHQASEQQANLENHQREHYGRAEKLGVKDYDETEDKAIDVLGTDVVNQIILNSDKSDQLLYYFGKNPNEAESLRDLMEESIVKGVMALGKLEGSLVVKSKRKATPDPDEELEGSTPSSNEAAQAKLDKLREGVMKGNDPKAMSKVLAYKKQCQEKGIHVT